jgi:Ca2+-transporting ATPase
MVAATRDIDPSDFDPNGDLLSKVTDLQMTAMVGMIDPPGPSPRTRSGTPRPPTSACGW